jgi:hypothetical protein
MYRGRISTPDLPHRTSFSLISFMIRICSMKSPLRSPSSPALLPATERSWQGLPPIMQSTIGAVSPLIFVISPRCFILATP